MNLLLELYIVFSNPRSSSQPPNDRWLYSSSSFSFAFLFFRTPIHHSYSTKPLLRPLCTGRPCSSHLSRLSACREIRSHPHCTMGCAIFRIYSLRPRTTGTMTDRTDGRARGTGKKMVSEGIRWVKTTHTRNNKSGGLIVRLTAGERKKRGRSYLAFCKFTQAPLASGRFPAVGVVAPTMWAIRQ